jgi:hypothetical protein
MAAAAPARKAPARAPARRKPARRAPQRRGGGGRTPHSGLRQKRQRSPRTARGARDAVRATSAPSRSKPRAQGGHLIPIAVGRTAVAMRGLPDSGLIVRLTRGRGWIAVLSVLLTGIVALNVVSLSLSASQGKTSQQAQIFEQENSALRARLAHRLSSGRVRSAAASLGMTSPAPSDINYRDASGEAVRLTARRLADGFGLGSSLVVAPTTTTPPPITTTTTSTTTPTTSAPVTADSAPTTTPSAPATPAVSTGTPGGGVSPG